MARRIKRLTPNLLRKMVIQEKKRLGEVLETGAEDSEKVNADETEASDLADSLEKDIDWMKALKIHESRLTKKLKKIKETKRAVRRRVLRKLK